MPDQTIKEHFDTTVTALDAARTRATGYGKTISMCLKENEWLRTTYKRYRTEKAQLGAENQTLRARTTDSRRSLSRMPTFSRRCRKR